MSPDIKHIILATMVVKCRTFTFRKVVRQQIWVRCQFLFELSPQIFSELASKKIMKIGPIKVAYFFLNTEYIKLLVVC